MPSVEDCIPLLLLALAAHVAVTMWISRQDHKYRYARKEEEARRDRRINYYYKTTHDFSYGKDIRIYNFRERIMANYQAEIDSMPIAFICLSDAQEMPELVCIAISRSENPLPVFSCFNFEIQA